MRDAVPYVATDKRGRKLWYLRDKPFAKVGLTATAGVGDMKEPPNDYSEMHAGAYDAKARLDYMDEIGIWDGDVSECRGLR